MSAVIIAPSILSADFSRLGEEVRAGGADCPFSPLAGRRLG